MIPALDIRDSSGMIVLAASLSTLFYGAFILQIGLYVGKNKKERWWTIAMVILLSMFDTMSWVCITYAVWWYFVVNFGNVAELAIPFWALKLEPGFTYTVVFCAHIFFIEKIWRLSKNHVIGVFMTFLALSTWGLGLGIMGLVFYLNSLTHPLITKVVIAQKVAGTLVEFSIALGMCYLFGSHRKRTVSTSTANILHRLIVFSLSRGVLMGLTQLAYTATFFAYQEKMYWVVLHCLASKLSANSALASLNIRDMIRNGGDTTLKSSRRAGSNSMMQSFSLRFQPFSEAIQFDIPPPVHGTEFELETLSGKSESSDIGAMATTVPPRPQDCAMANGGDIRKYSI